MTSVYTDYIAGPWNTPGAGSFELNAMTPPSTERSFSDEFMEEATKYLEDLARLNSTLFGTMADRTTPTPPPTGPDVSYFLDILNPTPTGPDTKPLREIIEGATFMVYEDGRRQYRCRKCRKLHDRKSRADDCRNADLGIKPYRCHGECGKNTCNQSYASEALLRRHCGPEHLRVTRCGQCHLQLYKQNLARHLRTCKGSPSQQRL